MAPCLKPCDRMPQGRRFGAHCHVEGCELGNDLSEMGSVCGLVYLGATDEQRKELDCAIIL